MIKEKIMDLLNTGFEVLEYIKKCIENNKFHNIENILLDLKEFIIIKEKYIENNLKSKKSILICKNTVNSIDKMILYFSRKKYNEGIYIFNIEIFPLYSELKEMINIEVNVLNNNKELYKYRIKRENRINYYANNIDDRKYKFEVSIVMYAYNKLEYTKRAIESILKHTDFTKGNIELITINNGSTDGTEEYLNSLPHNKKINLKYNIYGINVPKYCIEGKFCLGFSNDVIATRNWLDNLLKCIKSDDKIIWVVPTCNSSGISNNQGITTSYKNDFSSLSEIEELGSKHNISNPNLWEERPILMPFICLTRTSFTYGVGGTDKIYTQIEFADDDYSTSLRRAGLKQILAKDTFMHHFGSVTLKDNRKNGESIIAMREVYYKKWGVDAWDSRGEFEGIEKIVDEKLFCKNPNILFVEPRFGGNYLKIKNHIKSIGKNIGETTALVIDQRYYPDAKYMYDNIVVEKNITDFINKEVGKYELITFGTFLNDIVHDEIVEFIEKIYQLLSINGQLVFAIKNFRNAKILIQLISNNLRDLNEYDKVEFFGCNFPKFLNTLINRKKVGEIEYFQIVGNNKETDIIINMDNISYSQLSTEEQEEIRKGLDTDYFIVSIKRNA